MSKVSVKIEELSGVSQPVIARMEVRTSPPVGYGLRVLNQFKEDTSEAARRNEPRLAIA